MNFLVSSQKQFVIIPLYIVYISVMLTERD